MTGALHRHRDEVRVQVALTFLNYRVTVVDRVGRVADDTRTTSGLLVSVCKPPTWGASQIVLRVDDSEVDQAFSLASVISIELEVES